VEVGEEFGEVVGKFRRLGHLRRKVGWEKEGGSVDAAPQGGDIDEALGIIKRQFAGNT
jgi:hypothetical protein